MHETLSGRAKQLAHLTDQMRIRLCLADSTIVLINERLAELAEMGVDNIEIEGPAVYSRATGYAPAFDDSRIIYAAALVMPGGIGCTTWVADECAERYGESGREPPRLRERFIPYAKLPAIVRATLPDHCVSLLTELMQSFAALAN